MANSNLADMKLPELREIAKQMRLRGISTLRKPELINVIESARSGAAAPAGISVKKIPDAEMKKSPSSIKSVEVPSKKVPETIDLSIDLPKHPRRKSAPLDPDEQAAHEASRHQVKADLDDILSALPDRSERDRAQALEESAQKRAERGASAHDRRNRLSRSDRQQLDAQTENTDEEENSERPERSNRRDRDRFNREDRAERGDRRRGRDYTRDRKNKNGVSSHDAEDSSAEEPQEELIPVAGVVDILESYAFVRTSGYLPGPNDVYVSMGQVKKYGLRKGDAVRGFIRATREGERRNQRQKFVPLQSIESINGLTLEEAATRPQFSKLTPLYPQERLTMETQPNNITGRIMDIVSPIGKGQRGLIVSPPKAGKTITLQSIANSITANNPEVHLMVVLVDERPEEVTDMERTVQGEIIASTFDRPATDHTIVAELAIERAKRLVELGQDVVVLLDSMTRLARAYNIAAPTSGRILSGGVDAQALYPPKKFFGAARNIENGGSLTIISSALVETGSKMDEVIFEEFKGTGNMELRLSRDLSEKRLFPAIDINASSTRREELITDPAQMSIIYRLRRALGGLEPEAAYQQLVGRLKKTQTNAEFLKAMAQGN
ncbi:transcription termination factor Rho [Alloscardovia venturai]|uniref:Transcription termination factor Rho n=1 Tax=Alloscardovia venturai TaxID=1769421 RepID=A0ABW2Y3U3_9BIFI